ncbi:MAG: hypothetical protein ACR2H9_02095 [Longimicrobiaceae bacterium]|jgi:hypothetical protein
MIAGLPWSSWLLILASVLPALVLVLAFFLAHQDEDPHSDL